MEDTITSIINGVHIIACIFLILVVLLQQGKGGGLGAGFGSSATRQVFGGRGAGNLLTRLTAVTAVVFMTTSVVLAFMASSGDRPLRAYAEKAAMDDMDTPAQQPAEQPAQQPVEQPTPQPVEQPAQQPVEPPADTPSEP